ncbi:MAG: NAD(P)H-dependent glycerol-3-phosphate dehydrogenase [Anaerofustis stercorihominis]|nr:NAD(P)H-dependent glycerol-3-phosphate dehydrogenase [Anaerofustis stercorihominis]
MKISVLGCGRWGGFIAWYLNKIGHEVTSWGLEGCKEIVELMETGKNKYLTMPESVKLTSDLDMAVETADAMVISISSQALGSFAESLKKYDLSDKPIILCMKGINSKTGQRLTEVITEVLGEDLLLAIWVGPGHVQDYTAGIPNCMVIDSKNEELKRKLVDEFSSDLIRFYYGNDLIGNEVGAAAKNVIGLAAGMLDGANLTSLKGALMARGTREISRLMVAMGGDALTAYGLAHLGDYEATLFSKHSHNRMYGEAFIKGEDFGSLAEGVETVKAIMILKEKYNVEMPICEGVYNVIHKGMKAEEVMKSLFLRSIKEEFRG